MDVLASKPHASSGPLCHSRIRSHCRVWGHTPLISSLERLRQVGLYQFKANLVYTVNSRQPMLYTKTVSERKKDLTFPLRYFRV